MQGLELSRRYFDEAGLPLIKEHLPDVLPHLAAGLAGGSQAHGSDDEHSRDHGWGPRFFVWLPEDAFRQFVDPLHRALADLPDEFLGFAAGKAIVETIDAAITRDVGVATAPENALDWLRLPEESLFEVTHRPVFHDGPGEVTRRFEAFARYPEDVWRKRLSACLAWMSEWGVKHLRRSEVREDVVTVGYHWSQFATYAMKAGFLLNRRYAPYHKWLYRHFELLPELAHEIAPLLLEGASPGRPRTEIADEILAAYCHHLSSLGYTPKPPGERTVAAYYSEITGYAGAVGDTIGDDETKSLGTFVEIVAPPRLATATNMVFMA